MIAVIAAACEATPSEPAPPAPQAAARPAAPSDGEILYARQCAACHGAALEGGSAPSLAAASFQRGFGSVLDLYNYLKEAMPMNAPGSLTEDQYLSVIEYILQRRGVAFQPPLLRMDAATIALGGANATAVTTIPPTPRPIGAVARVAPPERSATPAAVAVGTNQPPAPPTLRQPALGPQHDISPYFVWFATGTFTDPNPGDAQTATEYEVWDADSKVLVWRAVVEGVSSRADLRSGTFMGPLRGRMGLLMNRVYRIRARVRDASGDPASEWSAWSLWTQRLVAAPTSGDRPSAYPLQLADVRRGSLRWTGPDGVALKLPEGSADPSVIEILAGNRVVYRLEGREGVGNVETDAAPLPELASVFVRITTGDADVLPAPDSMITFENSLGRTLAVHLPGLALGRGESVVLAAAANGSTYWEADSVLDADSAPAPRLASPARHTPQPWLTRPGHRVERITGGLRFPVQIAFIPEPGAGQNDPVAYLTELSGRILVVSRSGHWEVFADGLLNYDPTQPPVALAGENGLSGVVLDPASGDVFASLVFERDGDLFNQIIRVEVEDGGRRAGSINPILRMETNPTTASHQVHALTIGPDGKLYANVGNAFSSDQSQFDGTFNGKILRMNLDGSAPSDNPLYDPTRPGVPESYLFAKGIRNAFGAAWRAVDGQLYISENGSKLDRVVRVVAGANLGYDGRDASLVPGALYVFGPPAVAPTGIAALNEPRLPAAPGTLYVGTSARNFVRGPQATGKRIWQLELDAAGEVAGPPLELAAYVGDGRSSVSGVAFGPDGLYFLDLFPEYPEGGNPFTGESALWRLAYVGTTGS